jgi:hypothetical protein
MALRSTVVRLACLAAAVAPTPVQGQSATVHPTSHATLPPTSQHFGHNKKLLASYDSVADSTHLSVVTHKGKYFLTMQRPRLIWPASKISM